LKEKDKTGAKPLQGYQPRGFSWLDRALYGASWAGFLAVLAASALLSPSPSGLGTHTGLHLPPCGFYTVFGKPCPSCGMTTAFALIVHGHPVRAFEAQPAGVAVFAAMAWVWAYIPFAWKKRRPFEHLLEHRLFLPVVLGLIVLILTVWVFRAFF
jgi:hypothetical protein